MYSCDAWHIQCVPYPGYVFNYKFQNTSVLCMGPLQAHTPHRACRAALCPAWSPALGLHSQQQHHLCSLTDAPHTIYPPSSGDKLCAKARAATCPSHLSSCQSVQYSTCMYLVKVSSTFFLGAGKPQKTLDFGQDICCTLTVYIAYIL